MAGSLEAVVITGLSCQLSPDVDDARKLFDFCSSRKCAAQPIPASRWRHETWYHPAGKVNGTYNVEAGSYLARDVATFDAPFFNMSESEAIAMDPQNRLLLECGYTALENAGISLSDIQGRGDVGVFAASSKSDYSTHIESDPMMAPQLTATGTASTMFGNRLSYYFGIHGPSVSIDTACSSSLTALDLAINSLRSGRCQVALVGCSFLQLSPNSFSAMSALGVLSPQGKSSSFDADANGYGRGEGVGCLVLMSEKHARMCNSNVRAVVRASGLNHCGRSQGITSPDGPSQIQLIRDVYSSAGLDPTETAYVEAHGTGTPVGDGIEVHSIAKAFGVQERAADQTLYIGSAKSNFGHTEASSGIVSIIKCIAMLERGIILPNANFNSPNSALASYGSSLTVPTTCVPWPTGAPRRVSINNFGFGGSNAHVVLEYSETDHALANGCSSECGKTQAPTPQLFSFSAKDEHALNSQLAAYAKYLTLAPADPEWLTNLSYTLNCRRSRFPWQTAVVAMSPAELCERLQRQLPVARRLSKSSSVWVFTGQGSAWPQMATSMLHITSFRDTLQKADRAFKVLGARWSLLEELQRPPKESRLDAADLSQPAVTAVQVALVILLRQFGITPSAVTGHSSGEIAAAFAAGALDLDSCLAIAYYRGAVVSSPDVPETLGRGRMMAVGAAPAEVEQLVASLLTGLATIACYNSPDSVTVSGDEAAIEELQSLLQARGVFHRKLTVDQAYHSDHMLPYASPYYNLIKPVLLSMEPVVSQVRFFSSVTGAEVRLEQLKSPWHWVSNLASPVRFSDAFAAILKAMPSSKDTGLQVLEIGPHPALSGPVKSMLNARGSDVKTAYCATLVRNSDGETCMLNMMAALISAGAPVDAEKVFDCKNGNQSNTKARCLTDLPQYQFNHTRRYWHDSRLSDSPSKIGSVYNPILGHRVDQAPEPIIQCRNRFSLSDIPWLRDHVINGTTLFPLAGYICAVVEALHLLQIERAVAVKGYQLRDISISKALNLTENEKCEVWTTLTSNGDGSPAAELRFQINSWTAARGYLQHCSGMASLVLDKSEDLVADNSSRDLGSHLASMRRAAPYSIDCDQFYRFLKRGGLKYGPYFARITELWTGTRTAYGILSACDTTSSMPGSHEGPLIVHPTMLDAALHVGTIHIGSRNGDPANMRAHVPIHLDRVFVSSAAKHHNSLSLEVHSFGTHRAPKSRSSTASMIIVETGNDLPMIEMDRLESLDVHESEAYVKQADLINPHKIIWFDHPEDMRVTEFAEPLSSSDEEELATLRKINAAHLAKALICRPEKNAKMGLARLYDILSQALGKPDAVSEKTRPDSAHAASATEVMLENAGTSLSLMLNEGSARSELSSTEDTLRRLCDESVAFAAASQCMANLVGRFACLQPSMRVLEIAAGSGSNTLGLLRAMTSGSDSARFGHYTLTDGSSDNLSAAKARLTAWEQNMDFKGFDLNQDAIGQGFGLSSYDLITGFRALRGAPDLAKILRNLRQLLRPGGMLVITEMVRCTALNFPFALSPEWWTLEDRTPFRTQAEWSDLLDSAGFTSICGSWEDDAGNAVFWTRRKTRDELAANGISTEPIGIVASKTTAAKAAEVRDALSAKAGKHQWALSIMSPREAIGFAGVLVCLEDPSSFSLSIAEPESFDDIKDLLLSSKKVVWVTSPEYRDEESSIRAFALGFGRVVRGENASRQFVVLQADTGNRDTVALGRCLANLLNYTYFADADNKTQETGFRQCGDKLQVSRLLPDEELHKELDSLATIELSKKTKLSQCETSIAATCDQPGTLSSLHFASDDSTEEDVPLGENEVIVKVAAAGVNFKDLLITLGRVPWERPGKECAGTVIAVGENASRTYAVGDRVVHWGDGLFTNRVRCNTDEIARISGSMTMPEAASIPIVFATAYECLINVARLDEGERVLIHAASGGVGQAAIQIAQKLGAEIFCTVSSQEKKSLVMSRYGIPSDHIFSSRSVDFARGLMAATKQKGVDVVLNSMANEMLKATWNCIGTHGRFVEIGKRDALVNNSLDMAPFARGAQYSAVDLSITIGDKPKVARKLLQTVMDLFQDKHFRPAHPITSHPLGQIHGALRTMQTGQHLGKLVLSVDPEEEIEVRSKRPGLMCFMKNASYIIVGGTGGLGRAMVEWMIERGARHIHLLSRSGSKALKTASWAATLSVAEEFDATVAAHACNIGEYEDVQQTLGSIISGGEPPVRGVIHGAMVLRDALYETTNAQDWGAVIKPKIQGAFNLHKATINGELDFFVCLSSVSALGLALGQSSYAGSNSVLDAFCDWRAQNGFPAVSIGLPAIADAGYVAENAPLPGSGAFEGANMAFREVKLLIEAALSRACFSPASNNSHTVAGLLKHPALLTALQDKGPLFSVLLRDVANACGDSGAANTSGSGMSVRALVAEAENMEDAKTLVATALAAKISSMMSIAPDDITMETSLVDLGIDSLVAVEIRNWMSKELEATIPVLEIIGTGSVAALAELTVTKSPLTTRFVEGKAKDDEQDAKSSD